MANKFSDVDWKDFKRWVERYQSRFHLEVLIGGNIEKDSAINIYDSLLKKVKFVAIPKSEYKEWFVRSLIAKESKEKEEDKRNNTYVIRTFHSEYD